MTPPRPNEGIDVEKIARDIASIRVKDPELHYVAIVKCVAHALTQVRAETEAAVTKREQERAVPIFNCLKSQQKMEHRENCEGNVHGPICESMQEVLAAYENVATGAISDKILALKSSPVPEREKP